MENQNSFDLLAQQNLITQQLQLLNLEIQLGAFQQEAFQGNCGGSQFNGFYGRMEGGYGYQPSFDYAPRDDYYPQQNSYLPTMMEYPDDSYDNSYPLQPDTSQFMPNSLDDGAQDFYQSYGYEIPSSQEVWQQQQEISPSLEALLMAFIQESRATFQSHEASLRNLEDQIGLIAMQISEGPNGISPNEVMVSPMEQCNSLTTNGMSSLAVKESVEHEIFDVESVIEDHSEEGVDEFTPKVDEEEFTTLEGQKLLQVIKEFTIVESQVLESKAILPSCDIFKILIEDGSNHFLQPQSLNSFMQEVGNQEEKKGSHEPPNISSVLKGSSISFTSIIPRYLCLKKWDPGGSHFNICDKFFAFNFKPP